MIFKIRGNRENGHSIAVPTEAYNNADQALLVYLAYLVMRRQS